MTRYLVRFYKNLCSSDGHPFKCLQTQVDVKDATDATQAGRLASSIFETDRKICDWQLLADSREVVPVEPPAEPAADDSISIRPTAYLHAAVQALHKRAGRRRGARSR